MSLLHKELIFSRQRKRRGEKKLKDKEEQKLSNKGKKVIKNSCPSCRMRKKKFHIIVALEEDDERGREKLA